MLLQLEKIDVNIRDDYEGWGLGPGGKDKTALHIAMEQGYPDIVKLLLAHEDIKLDLLDEEERNPLNYLEGDIECVKLFLSDKRCTSDVVNHVGTRKTAPR